MKATQRMEGDDDTMFNAVSAAGKALWDACMAVEKSPLDSTEDDVKTRAFHYATSAVLNAAKMEAPVAMNAIACAAALAITDTEGAPHLMATLIIGSMLGQLESVYGVFANTEGNA